MYAEEPFFTRDHEGALFKLRYHDQTSVYRLGAEGATTDVVEINGIRHNQGIPHDERFIGITVSSQSGDVYETVHQRSVRGDDVGFHRYSRSGVTTLDTGGWSHDRQVGQRRQYADLAPREDAELDERICRRDG